MRLSRSLGSGRICSYASPPYLSASCKPDICCWNLFQPPVTELQKSEHTRPAEHVPTRGDLRCTDFFLAVVADRTLNRQVLRCCENHLLHQKPFVEARAVEMLCLLFVDFAGVNNKLELTAKGEQPLKLVCLTANDIGFAYAPRRNIYDW